MSKSKKDKLIVEDVETQTKSLIDSVIVTALEPVYAQGGQLSYGFVVTLDGTDYSFRTNTQGQLQLNGSGNFINSFILN